MVRRAPHGRHIAWEPLPQLAAELRTAFPQVEVHEAALAEAGRTEFVVVPEDLGYSGLRERSYPGEYRTERIEVAIERLDDALPEGYAPTLIKVNVEGAERGVFAGGLETIARHKPVIVFEHGLGGSDRYGTSSDHIFDLLVDHAGLRLFRTSTRTARSRASGSPSGSRPGRAGTSSPDPEHGAQSSGTMRTSGSGTMKRPPRSRNACSRSRNSSRKCHGQHEVVVGVIARDSSSLMIGIRGRDRLRAPLVLVAVGRVGDQGRVEARVLEDRVALGRGAVDVDRPALGGQAAAQRRDVVADLLRRLAERSYGSGESSASSNSRIRSACRAVVLGGRLPLPGARDEEPDRAAVDVVELGAQDLEPRLGQEPLDDRERVVLEVLVDDRVERVHLEHRRQVVQLHHPDAVVGQRAGDVGDEARGSSRS